MYGFCVASVSAVAPLRAGQNPPTELRYPANENLPDSGEKFKFEPDDKRPLAPGSYLLMGRVISGIFPGEKGPISWRRMNGVAIPCSLGDGEKMLAAMVKSLQK